MTDQLYSSNDQTIPYDPQMEEATLGGILIHPGTYFGVAASIQSTDFFLLRHQWIWEAIASAAGKHGAEFDYFMVAKELEASGHLDEIGGQAYLLQLINNTPTSVHAAQYATYVTSAATRRRLLEVSDIIRGAALDSSLDNERMLAKIETEFFNATARRGTRSVVSLQEAANAAFDEIIVQAHAKANDIYNPGGGVPTGYKALASILGHLQRQQVYVIGARPGMGKTAALVNIAMNVALHNFVNKRPQKVFIWSGEVTATQLAKRILSMLAAIDLHRIFQGDLGANEPQKLADAVGQCANYGIYIDDTPAITYTDLRSKVMRVGGATGIDLICVDYLMLMDIPSIKGLNRPAEVGMMVRNLKVLAAEANAPLLLASQLSRNVESRQVKVPVLSDLRETGDLEQDAYAVIFIYRDEVYNDATEFPNQALFIVAKHRNGPTGSAYLYYEKRLVTFLDGARRTIDLKND